MNTFHNVVEKRKL